MSGPNAILSAKKITAQAADWVAERNLPENWDSETQARLDAWLAESPANGRAYDEVEALWHFHPDCYVKKDGNAVTTVDAEQTNLRVVPLGAADAEAACRQQEEETQSHAC